jgi:hypothetical protein
MKFIGRNEVTAIGCIQADPPRAELVEGTTIVSIPACPGVRQAVEIQCRDSDEADMIACVIDQHLRIAFERQFR